MTYRLAIDLSSGSTGGAGTYNREVLPRLVRHPSLQVGPVLTPTPQILDCHDGAAWAIPAHNRLASRGSQWDAALNHFRPHLIYIPTEVTFRTYETPYVVALRSPLHDPVSTAEDRLTGRSRAKLRRALSKHNARKATHVIANSCYAATLGSKFLKIPDSQISVIYHGGPSHSGAHTRAPRNPPHNLIVVSNVATPYKNIHSLLIALGSLPPSLGWHLTVAGSIFLAWYRRYLFRLVRSYGLINRVRFLGGVQPTQLRELYSGSDALIWPSYAETFGHPMLEAHSRQLPILAADAASNREIAGNAAFYFDPHDLDDLATKLLALLRNGDTPGPLPRVYDWDTCADQTANVLLTAPRH